MHKLTDEFLENISEAVFRKMLEWIPRRTTENPTEIAGGFPQGVSGDICSDFTKNNSYSNWHTICQRHFSSNCQKKSVDRIFSIKNCSWNFWKKSARNFRRDSIRISKEIVGGSNKIYKRCFLGSYRKSTSRNFLKNSYRKFRRSD